MACQRGYGFLLEDECNYCTLQRIRELYPAHVHELGVRFGAGCHPVHNGVEVRVRGVPLVWFDQVPERCMCKL